MLQRRRDNTSGSECPRFKVTVLSPDTVVKNGHMRYESTERRWNSVALVEKARLRFFSLLGARRSLFWIVL